MQGFIWILVINFLIAAVYFLWNLLFKPREKTRSFIIKTIIMLLCPLAGACYLGVSYLLYALVYRGQADLEDVIFSKDRVRTFLRADEERERNMVPLEEAIAVTDKENLREYMMNVVRGDIEKSLASISLALDSEDSETSHYAASVLQDTLNDFRTTVQKNYHDICEEQDVELRISHCTMMLDYMDRVLKQKVFSDVEQKALVSTMDIIGNILYVDDHRRMTSGQLEALALRCTEAGDYTNGEIWSERALYLFPNTLSSYTCALKYFFTVQNKERFFEVLEDLKQSDVVVDQETLELIRVFS
jgi:hypothetical protein